MSSASAEYAAGYYERIKKLSHDAGSLKPIPLTIKPPPPDEKSPRGYYITGAEAARYKKEALAYNQKLLDYKRGVRSAFQAAVKNKAMSAQYAKDWQKHLKDLRAQAPQRAAFKEYITEYGPQTTGPPQPTTAQQARIEAGLPATGLPGPSQAAPRSIKAEIRPEATKYATSVLSKLEAPFRAVSGPVLEASRALQSLSHDVYKTDQVYQQPELFGAQTQPVRGFEEQLRVKGKQQPALGTAAYIASVGLDVASTGFDVATFPVRPGLMVSSAVGVIRLGTDADTQREFVKQVASDPFRFASKVVGGALLGGELQRAPAKIKSAGLKWWSERAKREFDRLGLDETLFTQFEREMLLDFPEETVDYVSTQRLFKRGTTKISSLDKGVSMELPYYVETLPEIEKLLQDTRGSMDTWKPLQLTKGDTALPYNIGAEGGFLKTTSATGGMKPFKVTDVLPVTKAPAAGQVSITVPKVPNITPGVTKTTGSLKPSFFETSMVQESTFYIPAVDLRSTLLSSPQVTIPNLFPSMVDFSLASLTIAGSMQTGKQRQVTEQAMKQITVPKILFKEITVPQMKMGQVVVPGLNQFSVSKPLQVQTPVPVQVQIPSVTQVQIPIQVSIQTPIQIQTPIPKQITTPTPPIPQITIPEYTVKPLLYVPEPEKKKKKRKVTKRKAIYERRVDPLKITFPEIKLPKVPKF